jgi:hypothetical protein
MNRRTSQLTDRSTRAQMGHAPSLAEELAAERRRSFLLKQCVDAGERFRIEQVSKLRAELRAARVRSES